MNKAIKRCLLICGSPKGNRGASWMLGNFIMDQMEKNGVETHRRAIIPSYANKDLMNDIEWAELVVLSFPLYADGLPAILLNELEVIYRAKPSAKYFSVICNSGFAESHQNKVALDICHSFAIQTGWKWLGGIGRGAGGFFGNKKIDAAGRMVKPVISALTDASELLASGKEISQEVIARAEAPLMSNTFYSFMGTIGMLLMIIKNKQIFRYKARPYDKLPNPGFE